MTTLRPDSIFIEVHGYREDGERVVITYAMEPDNPETSKLEWSIDRHLSHDSDFLGNYDRVLPTAIVDSKLEATRWRFIDPPATGLVERLVKERLEQEQRD